MHLLIKARQSGLELNSIGICGRPDPQSRRPAIAGTTKCKINHEGCLDLQSRRPAIAGTGKYLLCDAPSDVGGFLLNFKSAFKRPL